MTLLQAIIVTVMDPPEGPSSLTRQRRACTGLFLAHMRETSELQSLAKTRTRRSAMRRERRSKLMTKFNAAPFHQPSTSSPESTSTTSITPIHLVEVSLDGHLKVYFSGTRYQCAKLVLLYLVTGQNGKSLTERSLNDSVRKALFLFSSEALQDDTRSTSVPKTVTESYVQATHPHEATGLARRLSPEAVSSQQSMPTSGSSPLNR